MPFPTPYSLVPRTFNLLSPLMESYYFLIYMVDFLYIYICESIDSIPLEMALQVLKSHLTFPNWRLPPTHICLPQISLKLGGISSRPCYFVKISHRMYVLKRTKERSCSFFLFFLLITMDVRTPEINDTVNSRSDQLSYHLNSFYYLRDQLFTSWNHFCIFIHGLIHDISG